MSKEKRKVDWRSKLTKDQVLTIPNILSFFRIALIPVIIWVYCGLEMPLLALAFILLSGLTDIIDGYIARKYNMITDFGKSIDPIADKMTQIAVLICLVTRFKLMLLPLCIMAVKETVLLLARLWLFRKTEKIYGAVWHGKLNTTLLYLMIYTHIIWFNINNIVSTVLIYISAGFMMFSFVAYFVETIIYYLRSKEEAKRTTI
jgi:cardiolipin synthase